MDYRVCASAMTRYMARGQWLWLRPLITLKCLPFTYRNAMEEVCSFSRHIQVSVCFCLVYHSLGRQHLRVVFAREEFLHLCRHEVDGEWSLSWQRVSVTHLIGLNSLMMHFRPLAVMVNTVYSLAFKSLLWWQNFALASRPYSLCSSLQQPAAPASLSSSLLIHFFPIW